MRDYWLWSIYFPHIEKSARSVNDIHINTKKMLSPIYFIAFYCAQNYDQMKSTAQYRCN